MKAACLLTTIAWIAVIPRFAHEGTNIVTETYRLAATLFFHHGDPYMLPLPGGDRYEYSPFFCVLYGVFSVLPLKAQALAWAGFNAFFFWLGITRWVPIGKKSPGWVWVALLFCSMELNISLLYQQSNALLIGLCLIGLADYRDGKFLISGIILGIATNLKIYPALFVMLLLIPIKPRFLAGLGGAALATTLSPAFFVGISADIQLHVKWLHRLLEAAVYQREDLDISSVFGRLGAPLFGQALKGIIIVTTLALGVHSLFKEKNIEPIRIWIVLGMTALLLVNRRSESPTFVLLAPSYLFLSYFAFTKLRKTARWISLGLIYVSGFLITLVFTDAWPKRLWDPGTLRYATKTLGTLILWGVSVSWYLWYWRSRRTSELGRSF